MGLNNPAGLEDEDDVIDVPTDEEGNIDFGQDDGDDDHRADGQGEDDDNADDAPRSRQDDGEEDEDSDLGKRARKRIAQMRKKQGDAERRAIEAERRLRAYEERMAALENQHAQVTSESLERNIAEKRSALKDAIENGDTDAQLTLQDELTDLRLQQRSMQSRRPVQQRTEDDGEDRQQQAHQQAPQQRTKDDIYATMTPRGEQWARRLNLLDQDSHLIGIAVATEANIARAGYDRDSDEYFEALDAELRKRAPELYDGLDDDGMDVPRRKVQSPVAPPSRSSGSAPRQGGKVRLSAEQVKNMKTFGLDPNNPEHVRAYAQSAR